MKNFINDDYSDINNKEIISLLGSLDNINTYNKNNNINNNFNYNFHSDILNKKNKRKKRIKNEIPSHNTCEIGDSLSNIKKQLNNVSVNRKNPLKISKIKNYESPINKSYFFSINDNNRIKNKFKFNKEVKDWKTIIIKSNQISFSLLKSTSEKYDIMMRNKDLEKENDLLKENIKFLLSQIKKVKKIESVNKFNESSKQFDETKKKANNKNKQDNNYNKLNTIFDILSKYKKEINSLKQELNNVKKENKELNEYIFKNLKNDEDHDTIYHNYLNSVRIFHKKNILNNNPIKSIKLFNKKIPLNQRNNRGETLPYRKKSFNKTFSSHKNDNFNTYTYDDTNKSIKIFNYNTRFKKINNKYCYNISGQNKRNILNTFNNKGRNVILIEHDFNGDENIGNQTNPFTTKNNKMNGKLYSSNILYTDNNVDNISYNNNDKFKSPPNYKTELYHKKQISSNKIKKISINKYLQRKKLFNELTTKDSEKYIATQNIDNDNNIFKKIEKIYKKKET